METRVNRYEVMYLRTDVEILQCNAVFCMPFSRFTRLKQCSCSPSMPQETVGHHSTAVRLDGEELQNYTSDCFELAMISLSPITKSLLH